MSKNIKAANELGFAYLKLNLQLFSDEVSTDESGVGNDGTSYNDSALDTETPTDESVEQNVNDDVSVDYEKPAEDITQTQAFARRLAEEKAKFEEEKQRISEEVRQQAIDEHIASQGYTFNGKPITTEEEYLEALEAQEIAEQYDGEIDEETLEEIIEGRKARQELERIQNELSEQEMSIQEFQELVNEYPEINNLVLIPDEVWEIKVDKDIPLLDAYNRVIASQLGSKREEYRKQVEQEVIRKLTETGSKSGGSASNSPVQNATKSVWEMSESEYEDYKNRIFNT